MALTISIITGSLLFVNSYYVSVVYRFRIIVNTSLVAGNLPLLICGPTLITCSVLCHTEAHNNLWLVHSTKPARYV